MTLMLLFFTMPAMSTVHAVAEEMHGNKEYKK